MIDCERLPGDGFMYWAVPAMFGWKLLVEPLIARWKGWRFR